MRLEIRELCSDLTVLERTHLMVAKTGDLFKCVLLMTDLPGTDVWWPLTQAGVTHPTGMVSCSPYLGLRIIFV